MKPIHDLETGPVKNEAAGCAVPDFPGVRRFGVSGNQVLLSVSRDPNSPTSIHTAGGGAARSGFLERARTRDVVPLGRDSERP